MHIEYTDSNREGLQLTEKGTAPFFVNPWKKEAVPIFLFFSDPIANDR